MTSGKNIPKVSIILPTYNRGWILDEAVNSVLDQDYTNFELIVVDDGSTDDTRQILNRYGDRITVIRQSNQGVSAARNAGIRLAAGDLIAFLDSDDQWLKGKLTRQVAFFKRYAEMLICQTEEIWIRNGVRVNPKKKHRKQAGMIFKQCLPLCLVSPSAVMIRKHLFDEVGMFDERLPACEDYDLWLRIAFRYPIGLIDEPLIIKRGGHMDQLSRSPELDKYRILALKKVIDGDVLDPDQLEAAVQMLKKKCTIYGKGCRKRGRQAQAEHYFALADAYSPLLFGTEICLLKR